MYEEGGNSEEILTYNFLFCQACLSSNRTVTVVGEYIDIYTKICDISYMEDMASEIYICWECMALLKKIRSFKKKVENAQKILDYCINTQAPLYSLSDFTISSTETTTFVPIDIDEYEYEDLNKSDIKMESDYVKDDLDKLDVKNENPYDLKELTIKIEDVRSQFEAAKVKLDLDQSWNSSSGCEVSIKEESPAAPAPPAPEQDHQRWKQSIILVYKRICGHQHAHHFLRPVSDDIAPHYSRVVRRPSDLGTIRRHIRDGTIRTTAQFERALLLMFSNALMYNSSRDPIYHMALELRTEALRELSLLSSPLPSPRTRRAPAGSTSQDKPAAVTRPVSHPSNPKSPSKPHSKPKALFRRSRDSAPAEPESSPAVSRRRASQRPHESDSCSPEPAPAAVEPRRRSRGPGGTKRGASTWNWSTLEPDAELLVARHSTKKYKTVLL